MESHCNICYLAFKMHVIYGRAMALDLEKNDNYDKNNQFTAVR